LCKGGGIENFADTVGTMSQAQLESTIYQIYKADVLAIKNLADVATKLQAGGITVPGNLTVTNQVNINTTTDEHLKLAGSANPHITIESSSKPGNGAFIQHLSTDGLRLGMLNGSGFINMDRAGNTTVDGKITIVKGASISSGVTIGSGAIITGGLSVDSTTFAKPALPCQQPSRDANLGLGIPCLSPASSICAFQAFLICIHSPLVEFHRFVNAI